MMTQETIDRILRFDGDGLPVVSAYVRVEPDGSARTRVSSLLDQVGPLSRDRTLTHDARLSLHGDLDRITTAAEEERWKLGTTALFSCSGRDFFEEVSLPPARRDRIASAQVFELYLREMRPVRRFRDPIVRKADRAHDPHEGQHYRRVANALDECFRVAGFDLLTVGGHEHQVDGFLGFLPRRLHERLAGTFVVDANSATPADIRRAAESIMRRYAEDEQRRQVDGIVEAVAEGRPAVLGLPDCLWAGTLAAVQTLAVHDGTTVPKPGR